MNTNSYVMTVVMYLTKFSFVLFNRFPHVLPLIAMVEEFQELTGPVVMPTPVAHTSSLIKFVVIRNDQ